MKRFGNGILLLLVIIVSGAGFIYYTEGADAFSTKMVDIREEHKVAGQGVKDVVIKSTSTDVSVRPHDGEDIVVSLSGAVSEKMKDTYELSVEPVAGGMVEIVLDRVTRPSFTVFAINKRMVLTVQVPAKVYEALEVTTTSGDIAAEGLAADQVSLHAASGDIQAQGLTSGRVSLHTTSGDITSEVMPGGESFDVKATSGDVLLRAGAVSDFSLTAETSSGDLVSDVSGLRDASAEEDRFVGEKGAGTLKITVRTTSGDFTLGE